MNATLGLSLRAAAGQTVAVAALLTGFVLVSFDAATVVAGAEPRESRATPPPRVVFSEAPGAPSQQRPTRDGTVGRPEEAERIGSAPVQPRTPQRNVTFSSVDQNSSDQPANRQARNRAEPERQRNSPYAAPGTVFTSPDSFGNERQWPAWHQPMEPFTGARAATHYSRSSVVFSSQQSAEPFFGEQTAQHHVRLSIRPPSPRSVEPLAGGQDATVRFSAPGEIQSESNAPRPLQNPSAPPRVAFSTVLDDPPVPDQSAQDRPSGNDATATLPEDQTIGEAPEETDSNLTFLRRQTVLLEPGEREWDITIQYLVDESDLVLAAADENGAVAVGEVRRRQRLLLLPIEFRFGLTENTQTFVNVPFGWSNNESSFNGVDEFSNVAGIGDVSAGFTRVLKDGQGNHPTVLGSFSFTAPTGEAAFATSIVNPESNLGSGFWSLTGALNFIQTYDPVVLFAGFGYRHRFEATFDNGLDVNPGALAFYRFGVGFAVNPKVTFSAAFLGQYIGESKVNGIRLAGTSLEPINIRLATTIRRSNDDHHHHRIKTVEPFVSFGVNESAVDALFGISWTR